MKRFMTATLVALTLAAIAAPAAFAGRAGTSTCPYEGMQCVGSGGGAGR